MTTVNYKVKKIVLIYMYILYTCMMWNIIYVHDVGAFCE